ncbi:MAG: alpha/beta hydrolase [Gammaproteobacteria bacterium]|nr:MAG: alpha/beta hydrolase [Gammaproteobacteria bacterium]
MPAAVRRGYVTTATGTVHLRHAGNGPAVILLHDSPRSSRLYEALLPTLAERFTAVALDTPGYGNSSPLRTDTPLTMADFADALAGTVRALGLSGAPVYGFHTSSKIALEFAHRHPGLAGPVIMEGLSLPPEPPPEAFITRYMAPFVPALDGSHLAAVWTRIRDMHRFFPWFDLRAETRMAVDLPSPALLHDYSLDLFSAGAHYADAYAAAMRYSAAPALAALQGPAVICCRPSDVLYPYLQALPETRPAGLRVEQLPDKREAWAARLAELLGEAASAARGPHGLPGLQGATPPARGGPVYCPLPHGGQLHVHVHRGTRQASPPMLLLHDLPGAASELLPLFRALAARGRTVLLPEWPASGDSDPLPDATPTASAFAEALAALLAHQDIDACEVYAAFGSAPLALRLAVDHPTTVQALHLAGVPGLDARPRDVLARSSTPAIAPRGDGTHLLTLWHLLRDREIAWPWYDGTAEARRGITPTLCAERLQQTLLALLKQLPHWGAPVRAALREDASALLTTVGCPVQLLTRAEDRRDLPARASAQLGPQVRQRERPETPQALAELLATPGGRHPES